MRSAVTLAAFAAGALAVPYGFRHQKREVHTDYDVVIATDVVYVTAGQPAATAAAAAPSTTAADTTTVVLPTSTPVSISISVSEHQKWGAVAQHPQKPSSAAPSVVVITTVEGPQAPSSTFVPSPAPTPSVESKPEVQAPTVQAPAAPTPESSNAGNSAPVASSYQDIVILHHNVHRRNHSSPDIQWSDDLAASAASAASHCVFAHFMNELGGGYGQNIAAGYEPKDISSVVTDSWYNGEINWFTPNYGLAQPDTSSHSTFTSWGHFSQLVWKSTTHVGCATHFCGAGNLGNVAGDVAPYITVCNYAATGNMANEYAANINRPLGHPAVGPSYGL